MKAAVFQEVGKPLAIEEVPDPTPGARDLIVRVHSSGICGTDLHSAGLPPGLPRGTVMGHEFSGEVVEAGSDVRTDWKMGERLCALPFIGCGECVACLTGDCFRCTNGTITGLGQVPGAYAEFVRVGANEAVRLPESVDWDSGATVEPLAVGLHAVHRAQLRRGETALVIGAGPIGLAVTLWARFFGARVVAVSEKASGRLTLAAQFGATHGIDAGSEDPGETFARLAGGPPDVVFECVGVPGVLQSTIGLARPRGRVVVVGMCMQPDTIMPALAIAKELRLDFVVAYEKSDFEFTVDMMAGERIHSGPMITDHVTLDGFAEAFEALRTPTTQCKVLLHPHG
jgi:(R,R)-butanediol dehydrogenase/meso-butanediol dehydrogenase/diacetyl reductase